MQLEEFFDYKNQLMKDILTTPAIVDLLDAGVAGDDDITEIKEALAFKRVFPCEYVPETVQDGATFICFDVDVARSTDKTFLSPTLYIWVFTHRSKLRLPEGGVRTDRICNEICKAIDGSREYGLGELNLVACRRFAPMTDFQGKVLTFIAKDFKRQHDYNQKIPTNRKREV